MIITVDTEKISVKKLCSFNPQFIDLTEVLDHIRNIDAVLFCAELATISKVIQDISDQDYILFIEEYPYWPFGEMISLTDIVGDITDISAIEDRILGIYFKTTIDALTGGNEDEDKSKTGDSSVHRPEPPEVQ